MKNISLPPLTYNTRRLIARLCMIFTLLGQTPTVVPHSRVADAKPEDSAVGSYPSAGNTGAAQASVLHSNIVVKINPRLIPGSSAGDGSAVVSLLDGRGNLIASYGASVPQPGALARGVKGPSRNIKSGDTPFGVYRFTMTAGGTTSNRLGTGYGTGKVYVDDRRGRMYGDVVDARRSLIRLHGGGSRLPAPYAPDQRLLPTLGCVRMKNRDVNDLIRQIKRLPRTESLQFIFMGSDTYLRGLARNTNLRDKPWWVSLRTALGELAAMPSPSVIELAAWWSPVKGQEASADEDCGQRGTDAELLETVRVFSADEGQVGREALARLQPHKKTLEYLRRICPADHPMQPQLAFALCFIGGDCDGSRQALESALGETSPFEVFPSDQAAEMLSRLIDRREAEGQTPDAANAMYTLFEAAPDSDGALSEGLGATFTDKLRTQTRVFFSAFKRLLTPERGDRQDENSRSRVRSKVYELIRMVGRVAARDLVRIRQDVSEFRDSSRELKAAAKEFTKEYLQKYRESRQRRREQRKQR